MVPNIGTKKSEIKRKWKAAFLSVIFCLDETGTSVSKNFPLGFLNMVAISVDEFRVTSVISKHSLRR